MQLEPLEVLGPLESLVSLALRELLGPLVSLELREILEILATPESRV